MSTPRNAQSRNALNRAFEDSVTGIELPSCETCGGVAAATTDILYWPDMEPRTQCPECEIYLDRDGNPVGKLASGVVLTIILELRAGEPGYWRRGDSRDSGAPDGGDPVRDQTGPRARSGPR